MDEKTIIDTLGDLKHRVFPRPFERLGVSGKKLVGVEIGVFKGLHAESLLTHLDIECLYLIDPYSVYATNDSVRQYCGDDKDAMEIAKKECEERLAPYADKIVWILKNSMDALNDIPDGLDFAYIDGNHEENNVREDVANYYPKVKVGGIIGGHDFYNGHARDHDGVVRAVCEFAIQNKLPLQVELPDWWIKKP